MSMKKYSLLGAGIALLSFGLVLPANADSRIQTQAIEMETITGARMVEFASPIVAPANFTWPMNIYVAKNSSISTDTIITDQFQIASFTDYTSDSKQNLDDLPLHQSEYNKSLVSWAERIRECMSASPKLMRMAGKEADKQEVAVMINKVEGKLTMNGNNHAVCSL